MTGQTAGLPSALREQVIFPIDMNHSVLEDTFPFVLDTSHLHQNFSTG